MLEDDAVEEIDIEKKLFYKNMLIKSGIFCGFLAGFFVILVLLTLLGRNSWKNGLRQEIQQVMEKNAADIEIGEWVKIKSGLTVSVSVYRAAAKSGERNMYALIIRVPTLYGPVPAVFVTSDSGTEFIGFSDISDDIGGHIKDNSINMQIAYWEKKIPEIIKTEITDRR